MYFTDQGVEARKKRRGEEEVTFAWLSRARCGAPHRRSLKLRRHVLKIRCHRTAGRPSRMSTPHPESDPDGLKKQAKS
ncbi:DUF6104 family protein [Streptomyces californicus]|uniref:DUF6104 family protein n=1 Tax=Streptomyces californicus TaxID=67351 RepID=UPI0036FB3AA5